MIRPATEADRDAICALHLASWQDSYGAELPESYLRDRLPGDMAAKWAARRFAAPEVTLVAEGAAGLEGFVCALTDHDPPLIDNLHVRPDLRGRRIGADLLAAVLSALRDLDHAAAYLTVLESNPRARAFYMGQGGTDGGAVADQLVGHPVRARRIDFTLR